MFNKIKKDGEKYDEISIRFGGLVGAYTYENSYILIEDSIAYIATKKDTNLNGGQEISIVTYDFRKGDYQIKLINKGEI